jgi:hypothetical protein
VDSLHIAPLVLDAAQWRGAARQAPQPAQIRPLCAPRPSQRRTQSLSIGDIMKSRDNTGSVLIIIILIVIGFALQSCIASAKNGLADGHRRECEAKGGKFTEYRDNDLFFQAVERWSCDIPAEK